MAQSNKYWIEPGKFVERVVGPKVVLTVDEIIKEIIKENGIDRKVTKGVRCHWVTDAGLFQKAIFRTDELRPHINVENVKITAAG